MPRKPLGERAMEPAERQARRREHFREMREALSAVAEAKSLKEAREVARGTLERQGSMKKSD